MIDVPLCDDVAEAPAGLELIKAMTDGSGQGTKVTISASGESAGPEETLVNTRFRGGERRKKQLIATTRRISMDGLEIPLEEIQGVAYWSSKTGQRVNGVAITNAQRMFVVTGPAGTIRVNLISAGFYGLKRKSEWEQLVALARNVIEPRLCQILVGRLANGGRYELTWQGGELTLEANVFSYVQYGRSSVAEWKDFRGVRMKGGATVVDFQKPDGTQYAWEFPFAFAQVLNSPVVVRALPACAKAFSS